MVVVLPMVVLHAVQDNFMKRIFQLFLLILVSSMVNAQVYTYPMLAKQFSTSYVTGSAYSSHAPATTWFQHLENDEARAISYVDVVKSFGAGVPAGTSSTTWRGRWGSCS